MTQPLKGIVCAVAAYVLWGLLPIYWKALQSVSSVEILAHRIVWSLVFLAAFAWALRRQGTAWRQQLRHPRVLRLHGAAAVLLCVNWLTYIHGVNTDRILETSLGYYINPLVSVLLGVLVLHERLSRLQWLAIAFAAVGVTYLTIHVGHPPWIALILASTFALYGLAKKHASLPAIPGLILETATLVVPALGWMLFLAARGEGALGHAHALIQILLALGGIATSLPLLFFAEATRRIPLSTVGILQYIAPTCGLVIGVCLYGETFDTPRRVAFALIWVALGLYSLGRTRP